MQSHALLDPVNAMGVRGLWKVLEPTARPVSFEVLRGKILAVDASIWIYHFVKAMRDPSGVILRAAHIVGFFRRLCKLLFYEVKPVFIFDGQAPTVKKLTTARRQHRREGREFNARATANKLLTLQIQRAQQLGNEARPQKKRKGPTVVGSIPENANYIGQNTAAPEKFTAKDQYHLPDLEAIVPAGMEDHRLLSQDELDEYAAKFTMQARKGLLLSDDIDFESQEFKDLPSESKYQLLNMARMKSRLRMGYSTSELKSMFPDVLEFSRFQIQRVAQRNYFAQKLMTMSEEEDQTYKRISSEKNREYMLSQTGGGWSLSLGDRDANKQPTIFKNQVVSKSNAVTADEQPIKVEPVESIEQESIAEPRDAEERSPQALISDEESSDDVFEDVSIDGEAPEAVRPRKDVEFSNQMSALFAGLDESDEDPKIDEEPPAVEQPPWFENRNEAPEEPELVPDQEMGEYEFQNYQKMTARPGLQFYLQHARKRQANETFVDKKRKVDAALEATHSEKVSKKPFENPVSESRSDIVELDDSNNQSRKSQDNEINTQDSTETQKQEETSFPRLATNNSAADASESLLFAGLSDRTSSKQMSEPGILENNSESILLQGLNCEGSTQDTSKPESHSHDKNQESILLQDLDDVGDAKDKTTANAQGDLDEPESLLFQNLTDIQINSSLPQNQAVSDKPEIIDMTSPSENASSSHRPENNAVETQELQAFEVPANDDTNSEVSRISEAQLGRKGSNDTSARTPSPEVVELSENELELAENEALLSENEEDDLNAQMLIEVDEHARFTKNLAENARRQFDEQQFTRERDRLRKQYASEIRDADGVTEEMVRDCQELLQLFGIPYITAPTEAEAQCAALQELGLVDGVVTDDGDCFLFGNVTVYRNMFNQAKFVESYDSRQIEQKLGLDRGKLIELALLLGSDYTDGILGIGPVLGTEILAEFGDLKEFKSWWEKAQRAVDQESTTPLRKRLLKQHASKIFLKPEFPDKVVMNAYLHPAVEIDDSPFSWAAPDAKALCSFMEAHAGWVADTTNQLIDPVLQESKRRHLLKKSGQTQASLDEFYNSTKSLNLGSKRATAAAKRLASKKQAAK